MVDKQGEILLPNSQAAALFGYTRAELVGMRIDALIPERFRASHEQHREAYVAQPAVRPMGAGLELFGRRKDGSEVAVEISLSPFDVDGVTCTVAAIRDISERRRADATHRARENQLRNLGDNLPRGAIYQVVRRPDGSNYFPYMSAGLLAVFGLHTDDALNNPYALYRLVHPEDLPRLRAAGDASIRTGEAMDVEIRMRAVEGTDRWLNIRGRPTRLADGSTLWDAIALDVTDRRHAELQGRELIREQLARREAEHAAERARLLADTSRLLASSTNYETTLPELSLLLAPAFADWVAIHLAHRDGRVQRIRMRYTDFETQALADALDAAAPDMRWTAPPDPHLSALAEGRSVLLSDLDLDAMGAVIPSGSYRHLVATRLQPRSLVLVPLMARGLTIGSLMLISTNPARRYVEADVPFAEDLAGRIALAIDNARLVRAAERARAEAQHANDAKDVFLAMLAHELRNPLGAISNAVSVLDRTSQPDEAPSRARDIIKRQTAHLARMVDDLLDLTRAMTGKVALAPERLDLAESVAHSVAALSAVRAWDQHRLEVHTDPVWVEADRTRLEQVITNLLTNALKYTPAGGAIRVHVGADGSQAVLRITDTGMGITPELLPRVFDLFTQGERTLDRRQGGLGIGLTLVKRLVQQHGGEVEARSDGPDRGAEFIVRLPRVEPMTPGPAPVTASAAHGSPRRVLVIEDNDDARLMLVTALRLAGHEVHESADGEQGLQAALALEPDIALVDLGLPGIDGYELARRLRAAGCGTRLVAVTGYGQTDDRRRALEAGFDVHLVKPVGETELARIFQG